MDTNKVDVTFRLSDVSIRTKNKLQTTGIYIEIYASKSPSSNEYVRSEGSWNGDFMTEKGDLQTLEDLTEEDRKIVEAFNAKQKALNDSRKEIDKENIMHPLDPYYKWTSFDNWSRYKMTPKIVPGGHITNYEKTISLEANKTYLYIFLYEQEGMISTEGQNLGVTEKIPEGSGDCIEKYMANPYRATRVEIWRKLKIEPKEKYPAGKLYLPIIEWEKPTCNSIPPPPPPLDPTLTRVAVVWRLDHKRKGFPEMISLKNIDTGRVYLSATDWEDMREAEDIWISNIKRPLWMFDAVQTAVRMDIRTPVPTTYTRYINVPPGNYKFEAMEGTMRKIYDDPHFKTNAIDSYWNGNALLSLALVNENRDIVDVLIDWHGPHRTHPDGKITFDGEGVRYDGGYPWHPSPNISVPTPKRAAEIIEQAATQVKAVAATPSSLKKDLVSYWPLNGDLEDKLEYGNDGVFVDNEEEEYRTGDYRKGKYGKAAYLDGTKAIKIDDLILDVAIVDEESFSISLWFTEEWLSGAPGIYQCLVGAVASDARDSWGIQRAFTMKEMHFRTNANFPSMPIVTYKLYDDTDYYNNIPGGWIIEGGNAETWHHIVGVADSKTGIYTLYVDGVSVSRNNTKLADRGNKMMIGDNPDVRGRNWHGKVCEVGFWNRALNRNEVSHIYNSKTSLGDMIKISAPKKKEQQAPKTSTSQPSGSLNSGLSELHASIKAIEVEYDKQHVKLETNLVSYWPLNGDLEDKVEAGTNGVAAPYHSTVPSSVGNIRYRDGKFKGRQAAYLDGTNAIKIGDNENSYDFADTGSFSISTWFTSDSGGVVHDHDDRSSVVVGQEKILLSNGWRILWKIIRSGEQDASEPVLVFEGYDIDTMNQFRDLMTLERYKWHHLVCIVDSNKKEVINYLDGLEMKRLKIVNQKPSGENYMMIGAPHMEKKISWEDMPENWYGRVCEVAIWDRPLNVNEITTIYRSTTFLGDMIKISDPKKTTAEQAAQATTVAEQEAQATTVAVGGRLGPNNFKKYTISRFTIDWSHVWFAEYNWNGTKDEDNPLYGQADIRVFKERSFFSIDFPIIQDPHTQVFISVLGPTSPPQGNRVIQQPRPLIWNNTSEQWEDRDRILYIERTNKNTVTISLSGNAWNFQANNVKYFSSDSLNAWRYAEFQPIKDNFVNLNLPIYTAPKTSTSQPQLTSQPSGSLTRGLSELHATINAIKVEYNKQHEELVNNKELKKLLTEALPKIINLESMLGKNLKN
jgi:hypothetical protein